MFCKTRSFWTTSYCLSNTTTLVHGNRRSVFCPKSNLFPINQIILPYGRSQEAYERLYHFCCRQKTASTKFSWAKGTCRPRKSIHNSSLYYSRYTIVIGVVLPKRLFKLYIIKCFLRIIFLFLQSILIVHRTCFFCRNKTINTLYLLEHIRKLITTHSIISDVWLCWNICKNHTQGHKTSYK